MCFLYHPHVRRSLTIECYADITRLRRAQIAQADRLNLPSSKKSSAAFPGRVRDAVTMRSGPPFILSHDVTRGIIHAVQSALHFAIMLVVMYVVRRIRLLELAC